MVRQRLLELLRRGDSAEKVLANYLSENFDVPDGSISTSELADDALAASAAGRAKMADSFFNAATVDLKFATGSIGADRLTDSEITNAKVSASAAIDYSKLAALTSGNILVGNASNVATSVAMSGDVSIDNAGSTSVDAVNLETATVTNIADAELLIGTGAGTAGFAAMTGDVTMTNTGATTIAAGAVDVSKTASSELSGITTGFTKFKKIDAATVKPLLDGVTNNLLSLAAGNVVLDVIAVTQTAAGSAGTVDIGTDASWSTASDQDAFIAASNFNSAGFDRMIIKDAGGAAAGASGVVATGAANITITSSADLTASSWDGDVYVFYV